MKDELIRDRIVIGITDSRLRRNLLQDNNLTLAGAIDRGRAAETTSRQLKSMDAGDEVKAVRHKTKGHKSKHPQAKTSKPAYIKNCKYCGKGHERDKEKCYAYGKTCSYCGKKNHAESKCLAKKHKQRSKKGSKGVHLCADSSDCTSESDGYESVEIVTMETPDSVNATSSNDNHCSKLYVNMLIRKKKVRFQVDTGATVNVVDRCIVPPKCKIEETTTKLKMYNNTPMATMGKARIPMKNAKTNRKYSVTCVVVDNPTVQPILGLRAAKQMDLITVNTENISAVNQIQALSLEDIVSRYPSLFDGKLGLLKENVQLRIDPTVQPVKNALRRVPHALMDNLKKELDRLEKLQVIAKISEPTDWLSSLVTVKKPSGKLRVCIDPQPLNTALKRDPYMTPVLDDVLPKLTGAKVFSVIDVKDGYWNLKLSPESSDLTAMGTPFGNYKWLRLPFGVKPSSDHFQRELNDALKGLDGIYIIADDILVVGIGRNDEQATQNHDANLVALLQRCCEKRLKLNKEKIKLHCKEVPYMDNTLTPDGLKPDKSKIDAILLMQPPSDIKGVRRLLGMINYLTRFLPDMSATLEPIRRLTQKDVEFEWSHDQQRAFEKIKQLITSDKVLKYFDPKSENVTLQCDSSRAGLACCLLQDGRPIGFGSRSLTTAEKNYGQIELELLAVVFGLEHFHQMTYGRRIQVHSDHKPLENIIKKPLIKAPKRLQRMLLRISAYDIRIVYKSGTSDELKTADTLSRASLKTTEGPTADHNFHVFATEIENINLAENNDKKIDKIKRKTQEDPVLQMLIGAIVQGWPSSSNAVPQDIRPYANVKDYLTVQNGVIFNGDRIVIPQSMRKEIIRDIHTAHSGIEACINTARQYVYWPCITSQIKEHCAQCEICQSTINQNQQNEPLSSHNITSRPWQDISIDIFTFNNNNYLITVDNYSNFWEVDKLYNMTAKTVIHKIKHHFARYGICETIVSDNAQIFHSHLFKQFQKSYGFNHRFTSPHHQSANPAERAVKTCKQIMKKAKKAHQDVYLAILIHRNTIMTSYNTSPAQKFLGRRTKTILPTKESLLQPEIQNPELQNEIKKTQRAKQKFYYDRNAKELPILNPGDTVRMQPMERGNEWNKATVTQKVGNRSYEIQTDDDKSYRRNRKHLRKTAEKPSDPILDDNYGHQEATTENAISPKKSAPETTNKSPEKENRELRRSSRTRYKFTHYQHIPM